MNLCSCKTCRWLWLALSLLLFLVIGFVPLFRYGKTADSHVLRLAPHLVYCLGLDDLGFWGTIHEMLVVVFWVSFAIALGWLIQCFVVILLSWIHESTPCHFQLQANGLLHKVGPVGSTLITYMPQSLSQVILHIVFSTKERRPWLDSEIRPRMHGYLATVCRDCECQAYRVGGTADHVHIAARLARTVSQADLLEKIKKTSSAWIKQQGNQYAEFFWQGGYGDFSIGWSQLEELERYIDHQEQHHRTQTFQQEYRSLLDKYHVEFDERYVWD